MGLWSKLTGGQTATTPTGRTPAENRRRNREIRKIDAGTAARLHPGDLAPRKGER
ncbi:hypothetical protein [Kitasatospora sp. NPDC005748]|uniref:hypothetical protein n=1 Tax=Kitasatospora sp. NPDC005748 TaxID=3157063 RepID=UPI0033F443AF